MGDMVCNAVLVSQQKSVVDVSTKNKVSTQSQSSDCAGLCPPLPFCQDRVAVGPAA